MNEENSDELADRRELLKLDSSQVIGKADDCRDREVAGDRTVHSKD